MNWPVWRRLWCALFHGGFEDVGDVYIPSNKTVVWKQCKCCHRIFEYPIGRTIFVCR